MLTSGKRFGSKPLMFVLNPTEVVDVNWPEDLQLAETIAAGARARENLALGALFPYLTSSMLADITREMGHNFVLPKEIMGGGRFFWAGQNLAAGSSQRERIVAGHL